MSAVVIAMPHPQQAALLSQLPSNRQAVVPQPAQPIYIIPQHQVTSGMPPTPSVAAAAAAYQPTQFGKNLKSLITNHYYNFWPWIVHFFMQIYIKSL